MKKKLFLGLLVICFNSILYSQDSIIFEYQRTYISEDASMTFYSSTDSHLLLYDIYMSKDGYGLGAYTNTCELVIKGFAEYYYKTNAYKK